MVEVGGDATTTTTITTTTTTITTTSTHFPLTHWLSPCRFPTPPPRPTWERAADKVTDERFQIRRREVLHPDDRTTITTTTTTTSRCHRSV
ncbi:hypothetical protein E2C01_075433 [Portunus trituberculatus]|uniref:Uncharacterized protein n=1 Tax=Portunus trituberculatus TaxID=210409 RepID=A0A5B7I8J4_PORTR|nr:hypothetical protein [Portunus trituberculatus]